MSMTTTTHNPALCVPSFIYLQSGPKVRHY